MTDKEIDPLEYIICLPEGDCFNCLNFKCPIIKIERDKRILKRLEEEKRNGKRNNKTRN